MRLFIVGAALLFTTAAAAQSRWTVSAGPEWNRTWIAPLQRTWGMRARAEYDLTRPNNVFGLRFETSGRWSPAYSYSFSSGSDASGGTEQTFDLMLGFNASVSPMPRARFSPYVTVGVYGLQQWLQWSTYQTGSFVSIRPLRTESRLTIAGAYGVGLRMRLGDRMFQMEYRKIYDQTGLTFGMRLPF